MGGGNPTSWVLTDPLFEIGNSQFGTPRSNAVTVLKNGKVGLGTTSPESQLHIAATSAGTVTADWDADRFTLQILGLIP